MKLSDRLIDPRSPDRRPRRAAYALPTAFTAGNVFLGFVAILQAFQGAMSAMGGHYEANSHFEAAAKMIGVAVLLDGLDGRIARMTNTVSDFGREMDSLADVITFGIAPAVLAYAWGIQFIQPPIDEGNSARSDSARRLLRLLPVSAVRCSSPGTLQYHDEPCAKESGPSRPEVFCWPADTFGGRHGGRGGVCIGTAPLRWWPFAVVWLLLLMLLSYLMVCTWRYPSFKDVNLMLARSPLTFVLIGSLIYLIWVASQPVSCPGGGLRWKRHRSSPRRHHPAQAAPYSTTPSGAPGWLIFTFPLPPSLAANH